MIYINKALNIYSIKYVDATSNVALNIYYGGVSKSSLSYPSPNTCGILLEVFLQFSFRLWHAGGSLTPCLRTHTSYLWSVWTAHTWQHQSPHRILQWACHTHHGLWSLSISAAYSLWAHWLHRWTLRTGTPPLLPVLIQAHSFPASSIEARSAKHHTPFSQSFCNMGAVLAPDKYYGSPLWASGRILLLP